MKGKLSVDIRSEIGILESVIIHTPGAEVENMTPENAERALYSDILNLNIGLTEYNQLHGVLSKVAQTFEVSELLEEIVGQPEVKEELVGNICRNENAESIRDYLLDLPARQLATALIEGVLMEKDNSYLQIPLGR